MVRLVALHTADPKPMKKRPQVKAAEKPRAPRRMLQPALQTAGLQQYWRKLYEMGYQHVGQLLRLGRGKVPTRHVRAVPTYFLPPHAH